MRWYIIPLAILLITSEIGYGATTGKIKGKVINAATEAPLVGTNIVLKGTDMGASSQEDGTYYILNIHPGNYTLVASSIGYKDYIVENVRVNADHTTTIDIAMEQTTLVGEEVVVTAERPLIQRDVTSSMKIVDSEEIVTMPVNSFVDILNTSTGVVFTGNEENQQLHVRGGRSGEVKYLIDGFTVDDVVYRGMASDVNTEGISELSLITGTFNAEYGEAASAVVNIVTKEGQNHYTGNVKVITDKPGRIFGTRLPSDFNSQRFEGSFGGPLPFLSSFGNFFVSGDIYSTDTYLGRTIIPRTIIDPRKPKWEAFTDLNENGIYDDGEELLDKNGNGEWDLTAGSEPFTDLNGNKNWDEGEPFEDIYPDGQWNHTIAQTRDGTRLKKGNYRNNQTYKDQKRVTSKVVIKPVENLKVIAGYTGFWEENRGYSHYYKQFPKHNAINWDRSNLYSLTFNHTLSPSTYYQIKFSRFDNFSATGLPQYLNDDLEFFSKIFREPFTDENGNGDWDSGEPYTDYNGNGTWDEQAEWWSYMPEPYFDSNNTSAFEDTADTFIDMDGDNQYSKGIVTPLTVYIDSLGSNYEFAGSYPELNAFGDTVRWLTSDDNFWRNYSSVTTRIGGVFSSQITTHHHLKLGVESEQHAIRNHWINGVNPNGPDAHYEVTDYTKDPRQVNAWIQDKMEFSDMVINIGLRFDYLDPQGQYLSDPYSPFYNDTTGTDANGEPIVERRLALTTAEDKWQISPRLGFGYPITENILFRFSYGKFFQNPGFDRFWRRVNQNLDSGQNFDFGEGFVPTIGNPNLKPQSTAAYEFGMEQIIAQNIKFSVTLFYKDQFNYPTSFVYDVDPTPYSMFINGDYANTRGIELHLSKKYSQKWSGEFNYTYSKAVGNANDEYTHWNEWYLGSVYGDYPAKKTITMSWDQPHTLNFIVNYRKPRSWGINLVGNLGSGLPYTPRDARGRKIDETNSARKPPTVNIDLRANKDFHMNKFTLRLFADVYNLLDYENINTVFTTTGQPDQSANPNTSLDNMDRPHYYNAPRHIELGLQVLFDNRGGVR